jgi:methionine-S-sulfoxide reductase
MMKEMKATFAGGCFWCMEPPFKEINGVLHVMPGYTGGHVEHPTYEEVCSGETGHYEAVEVIYDADTVDYDALLEAFWRQINPADAGGQFADRGPQYRTAIFYHNEEQRQKAEESKKKLLESGKFGDSIATDILPAVKFFPAEEYHRNFAENNSHRYRMYKMLSGRDLFLKENWK